MLRPRIVLVMQAGDAMDFFWYLLLAAAIWAMVLGLALGCARLEQRKAKR